MQDDIPPKNWHISFFALSHGIGPELHGSLNKTGMVELQSDTAALEIEILKKKKNNNNNNNKNTIESQNIF